ncbi:serine hydrolase [Erythrobacter sp.]|jgi:beta-lactamase class A|uniref:serine hydrolase n=1 Tax=Erythrobacter sp. TaxID=1042 RepID=UPI002EBE0546|nr:serine hydrolase [Erythrobacter sp.]
MNRTAFLVAVAAALAAPLPLAAQDTAPVASEPVAQAASSALEARADEVVAVINGDIAPEEVFSDSFFADVPPERFRAISQQLTGQFGAAIAVETLDPADGTRARIEIRMEKAIAKGGIAIDPAAENRVSELLFRTFDPIDDSAAKIRADLAALPGTTNALFARLDRLDQPVFAVNADTQLALGSAFKLYVLSALAEAVEAGDLAWDDVVELTEKSFPSGQMQDWPQGAPVTLHTLATMMISISDNTATDQLISVLGKDRVEAEIAASGNADPSRSVPLLTTRELFAMRGVSEEFLAAYRAADDDEQRAMLAAMTEADVSMEQVQATFATETPGAIDIEWFASPRDLAGLLARIAGREDDTARGVMAVQPRLSEERAADWVYAGFKGGSEPGVLNLTWLLRDGQGEYWILTAGWNNPDAGLENAALETIAQRILFLSR